MKKRKIELTENGKAVLVTAPISLFAFEVLAHGGTIGFALAAASTFVAARHGSDIKNAGERLLRGFVASREKERSFDEEDEPIDEPVSPMEENIEQLRHMAYQEYLKTIHWQKTRKGALERAKGHCQVCRAQDVQLDVHHNTYVRLGHERDDDLFVLCNDCHELFSKSGKLADQIEEKDEEDDTPDMFNDDDDEIELLSFGSPKQISVFSELLKTGWRPSMERIYVGTDESGNHLFIPVTKLWHVALAGATGHGKSSLMRLLMAQLCYLKLPVILLNPHYMIYDFDHREDWTPYTPYLKNDPMVYKRMENIERALKWMAEELLEKRKERASQGLSAGKPVFYILDEYPDIKAEVKEAPTYVGKLLRQGRKYGIYLIVASQNYDVKTLGVEGEGGVRKCFRTIFYVGGDPVSVKELLNKAVRDIPENELGQGTIMLKCASAKDPLVVHVPYLDNESLYLLLGPSTYIKKPVQEEVHTDELEKGTVPSQDDDDMAAGIDEKHTEVLDEPTVKPNMPDKGRKAEEIDPKMAIEIWNAGYNSKRKLMSVFGITDHQALKLMEIIGVKEK